MVTALVTTETLRARLRELDDLAVRVEVERRELRRRIAEREGTAPRPRARQARHGTDAGYYAHRRRWKTPTCGPCRRAHAEAVQRNEAGPVTVDGYTWEDWADAREAAGFSARRIRTWARRHGLDVADYGKLPLAALAAYCKAHNVTPAPAGTEPEENAA